MEISKSFLKKKLWSTDGPQKIFPKNFLKSDASGEEGGEGGVGLMEISKSFLKKKLWSIGGPQKIFPKNFLKSDASGEEGGGGLWVSWKKLVFG